MTYLLLLSGSRHWPQEANHQVHGYLSQKLSEHPDLVLMHGACPKGVDALGAGWAAANRVPERPFPARWKLGRDAGFMRNQVMVDQIPDLAVFFRAPGASLGALDCLGRARRAGIRTDLLLLQTGV